MCCLPLLSWCLPSSALRRCSAKFHCGCSRCATACTVMYITHIKTESENVELVLRSALAKRRWCGRKNAVSTVCLDAPLDDKTRRICETVCRDYGFAHLITKDEFLKTLE